MKKQAFVIFWDYATHDVSFTDLFDWRMNKDRYKNCTSLNIVEGKRELYKELKSLETFRPAYLDNKQN